MSVVKSLDFLRRWSQLNRYLPKLRLRGFPFIYALIILVFVFMAFFGEMLAPYNATKPNLTEMFLAPFFEANGSMAHPLGTDMLGRDMLSRIMTGARVSFIVAMLVLIIGGLGGSALGIISGYLGGKLDAVIMRMADAMIAIPEVLIAMMLAIALGPSMGNVVFAISAILWARFARVVRGEVLSLKERDFVAQARVAGTSKWRIMFSHLLPNVMHSILVMLTLQVGFVIIVEATLSFLGAGIPPPAPAWGRLIADGRDYITTAWWICAIPGLILAAVCLSFNMLGDWLREALDPKLRQV